MSCSICVQYLCNILKVYHLVLESKFHERIKYRLLYDVNKIVEDIVKVLLNNFSSEPKKREKCVIFSPI